MKPEEPMIHLTFTLSPVQRILNPPSRLLFCLLLIVLSTGLASLCVFMVISAPASVTNWAVAIVTALGGFLVFRAPLRSLYQSAAGGEYIRCLAVAPSDIHFGRNSLEAKLPRKVARVGRGLAGTSIIHFPIAAIVVPAEAIDFRRLKELVEAAVPKNDPETSNPQAS